MAQKYITWDHASAAYLAAAIAKVRQPRIRVVAWLLDNSTAGGVVTADERFGDYFPATALVNGRTAPEKCWCLARDDAYLSLGMYAIDFGHEGGWFGIQDSDALGDLPSAEEVVITYPTAQNIRWLGWWGDSWLGYPVDFEAFYWSGGAWHSITSEAGYASTSWEYEPAPALTTTKLKLEITKISRANSHAYLAEFQGGIREDISAYVQRCEVSKERSYREMGSLPVGNHGASTCNLVLDNTDRRFSPKYAAGPYYGTLKPNRRLEVELGFVLPGGTTEYLKAGVFYASSWRAADNDPTASVVAYDRSTRMNRQTVALAVQEGKTISELVEILALEMPEMDASEYGIDDCPTVVPYAIFSGDSIWTYLKDIAKASCGCIYFDESGALIYEAYDALLDRVAPRMTLADTALVVSLTDAAESGQLRNRIIVKSTGYKELAEDTIWELQEAVTVPHGSGVSLYVKFPASVDVQDAVITAGGPDCLVTYCAYTGTTGQVDIANVGAADEQVTGLTIAGKKLEVDGELEVTAEDSALIIEYGLLDFPLESDFLQSRDLAAVLAPALLLSFCQVDREIELRMENAGLPQLQLGDRVHVEDAVTGIDGEYWVVAERLVYSEAGLDGALRLVKATATGGIG